MKKKTFWGIYMSSFNSMDTNFVPRYEEWHVQSTFLKRNDLTLSARCITSNSTINHCTLQDSLVVDVLMTPYFLLLHDFSQCVYFCSQRVGLVSSIEKWESEQETWMNFVFPKIYWTWHVKVVNIVLFFWYNEGKNAAVEILNWGTRVQIVLEAAQGTVYRQLDILWAFFLSGICSFIFSTWGIPVICTGLDYLHNGCSPPIIHRDVKSSNILLGRNLQAKIADMGLSRSYLSDTQTHISATAAGTAGYMDPEYVDVSLWYTITFLCLFHCSLYSKFRICSKTSKIVIPVCNMFSFSHSL